MLTMRRRGGLGHWYIRGVHRIGAQKIWLAERSTGTADRALAESIRAKITRDLEAQALHGVRPDTRHLTFAEAAILYLEARPRSSADRARIGQLARAFGTRLLREIDAEAFERFRAEHLPGRAPNSVQRSKTVLSAVAKIGGVTLELPSYARRIELTRWLSLETADRLCNAYNERVRAVAILARYSGLRASDLARLERRDIDLAQFGGAGGILVRDPKNGVERVVPLHPRAREAITPCIAGKAWNDPLFISTSGARYADTTLTGGNPFSKAHETACRRAGISDFRWHDWRHHWATWMLRPAAEGGAGVDLKTLMTLGGWRSIEQVARYAGAMTAASAAPLLARIA